jgi:hypothetical protein
VLANDVTRVYWYTAREPEPGDSYEYQYYFACRYETRRVFELGRTGSGECCEPYRSIKHVRVADDKVAYVSAAETDRHARQRWFELYVLDTATGANELAFTSSYLSGYDGTFEVNDVELRPTGSVAWMESHIYADPATHTDRSQWEVRKSDATGRNVVVDAGTEIDPNSLSLSGTTLSWIHAGERRQATLD